MSVKRKTDTTPLSQDSRDARQLEYEHIHLLLINEASRGLDDVAAGRVKAARAMLLERQSAYRRALRA